MSVFNSSQNILNNFLKKKKILITIYIKYNNIYQISRGDTRTRYIYGYLYRQMSKQSSFTRKKCKCKYMNSSATEEFTIYWKRVIFRGTRQFVHRNDVLYFSSLASLLRLPSPIPGKTRIFSASALQISRHGGRIARRVRTTSFLRACVEC